MTTVTRANAGFALQHRALRRATIHGEIPIGIDDHSGRAVRMEMALERQTA